MSLKNLFLKRKSIFFSWLLSYISILLIPVIASGIVYIQSNRIIESEINRGNEALLKLIQQDIDNKMKEVEDLSLQVAFNPKIEGILNVKGSLQTSQKYTVSEIVGDLARYNTFKPFVYSLYVLLKGTDLVLAQTALYDLKFLYEEVHHYQGITYNEFYNVVRDRHVKDYFPLTIIDENGNIKKTIAFAQSIPLVDTGKSMGTVMILIDEAQLQKVIQSLKWVEKGTVFILNNKNEIISSNRPIELTQAIKYEKLIQPGKLLYDEFKGEKVIISYNASLISDWKYVSVVPVSVFMEKAQYIRKIIIISILLCILIGGNVAYFFTKKNYNPINELVLAIAKMAGISIDKSYNEYRFIREAMSNTFTEKDKINERIKMQNIALRANFLMRLLKGRAGNSISMQTSLESFNLNFKSDYFIVMLFYLEDFDKFYPDKEAEENLKLVQFIISNVVEELTGKSHHGYMTEIDEMMACLINFDEERIACKRKELTEITHETQQFLQDKFHIYLTITISNVHKDLEGIPKAYQEALETMEYRMVMGSGKVIYYEDIRNTSSNYYYPIETENQLINYIKIGNFEKAVGLLNEVFENNFSKEFLPIQIVKCLLFNLVGTMIKAMSEINVTFESSFIQELDPINRLLRCVTVIEMKEQLIHILKVISEYIIKNKKSHNEGLKMDLAEYVENNYYDVNLSITKIAEEFQMHPVYLSSFCKEQTGESLLDYINKVRVDKAKKLLKEQKMNISDIAKKVGYYDCKALIRIFKKYEGITPGQYKEFNR